MTLCAQIIHSNILDFSASGKILRKDLRDRAAKELLVNPLPVRSRL